MIAAQWSARDGSRVLRTVLYGWGSVAEGEDGTISRFVEMPAGAQFDALWKAEIKKPRQTYDAQNFDAAMLCFLGATAAGSSDGRDIQASSAPWPMHSSRCPAAAIRMISAHASAAAPQDASSR